MIFQKFVIQVDAGLLQSTNGQITNVGVLITQNPPGRFGQVTFLLIDSVHVNNLFSIITAPADGDAKDYLGKTYSEWQNGDAPVYLATVIENSFQSRSVQEKLFIQVGDETQWEGYTNGLLNSGTYQ